MMPETGKGHWHFDPTVNAGHLLTTFSIVVAVILWGARLEGRVDSAEQYDKHQDKLIEVYQDDTRTTIGEIKELLKEISSKLDRKADRPR